MKRWMSKGLVAVLFLLLLAGCNLGGEEPLRIEGQGREKKESLIHPEGMTLETRIATPEGFTRTKGDEFTQFLRNYPLLEDGTPVRLYNGWRKGNQRDHVAVFDMHLEDRDLQQCADTVFRVYAEFLRQAGRQDEIGFHFVNGFYCDYPHWMEGYRVDMDEMTWVPGGDEGDTDENFEKYLTMVFAYSSTLSLEEESHEISLEEIQPGDVFLRGGAPGHVCIVVDTCEKEGEKAFLLAQGYTPAQQFHLLKNPKHEEDPWYYLSEFEWPFVTPEHTFEEGMLERPDYLEQ